MQKTKLKIIFLLILIFLGINISNNAKATNFPILNFSDLINGPKSGLGDGLGEGAIVTIWGNNLGSSQGTSKIYFRDSSNVVHEAAYIYYWKNADGQLPGGPSDLYTSHKMQEIAFSIPSAVADGAGKIYVEVGGEISNELDFYARSTGNIYFCDINNGNESNNGSYLSPFATPDPFLDDVISNGDILYIRGGIYSGEYGYWAGDGNLKLENQNGIPTAYNAIIGYPRENAVIQSAYDTGRWVTTSNGYGYDEPYYWLFSRLNFDGNGYGTVGVSSGGAGIIDSVDDEESGGAYWRIIGNKMSNGFKGASTTMTGVITINGDGFKVYGNEIYDIGISGNVFTNNHIIYVRVGSDNTDIGWNNIRDNAVGYQIQIHTDNANNYGIVWENTLIHNNYIDGGVVSGDTRGITQSSVDPISHTYVYNNIFDSIQGENGAVCMYWGNMDVYNNIFYKTGNSANSTIVSQCEYQKQWKINNNIIYSFSTDVPYVKMFSGCVNSGDANIEDIIEFDNNVLYNGTGYLPSSETDSVYANPLLADPISGDFTLQSTSPAIDTGTTLASVSNDFLGTSRPQGIAYDIGAFEYVSAAEETCTDGVQNQDETGIDCGGVCEACAVPITYNLSNFISAITNWLGIGDSNSDVNSDGIVNTRDLGTMMSNWSQ